MATSVVERLAGAVLLAEALALLAVVGWEIVALVTGDSLDAPSSIALIVLTAVGAAALAAFAVSVWRGVSWGRSGGIVAQLLILAVALGAATGQYADAATAVIIAVPGVIGFVLLLAAARRAAPPRPRD
ncbi:MAG: histidine kinase [Microbacterium arborescens]